MDRSQCTSTDAAREAHDRLTQELIGVQIETWLLEVRQAEVRRRLQQLRTRRGGLGREYRQLHVTP